MSTAFGTTFAASIAAGHPGAKRITLRNGAGIARFYKPPARRSSLAAFRRLAAANVPLLPIWVAPDPYGPNDPFNYSGLIVGPNPLTTGGSASITYDFFIVKFNFTVGGHTISFDPTREACNDSVPVLTRVIASPLFTVPQNFSWISNGADLGDTQYEDAYMRANYFNTVGGGYLAANNYHVLLTPGTVKVITLNVPANTPNNPNPNGSYGNVYSLTGLKCGASPDTLIGVFNINWFDTLVQSHAQMFKTNHVPIILSYNTFGSSDGTMTTKTCCVLGYHSAVNASPQTYLFAVDNDPGMFTNPFGATVPLQDIAALSHELGELLNDPYGTNPTPPWGNVGQVTSGCQSTLEVGDPLTGVAVNPLPPPVNGYTYHPQDLVFYSWFFPGTTPIGTNAPLNPSFSFSGSISAPETPCS